MKVNIMQQANLFVGSLSYSTTDESLHDFFAQIGKVKRAMVAKDRDTNRSRGFGFVTFDDETNNQKAISQLNGQQLDGREIIVNEAKPREDKPRRDFGGDKHRNSSFRQKSW